MGFIRKLVTSKIFLGAVLVMSFLLYHVSSTRLSVDDQAASILEQAESWTIASIYPYGLRRERLRPGLSEDVWEERFYQLHDELIASGRVIESYEVTGRALLSDHAERRELTRTLNRAIRWASSWSALCFWPRHAILGSTEDGDEAVLLICFQCNSIRVFVNGERMPGQVHVSAGGKATLDRVFVAAGLTIAD